MADKHANHPDGKHVIRFREQDHSYIDNMGSRYVSVTTFIKQFFPQFDAVAVSGKCAAGDNPKYSGRNPQEIMKEWAAEGKRGSEEGTNVHEYAEFWASPPGKSIKPISERCKMLFLQVDTAIRAMLHKGLIFLPSEMIIFSPKLGIAGTIDQLILDQETRQIIIADWKQNKNTMSTENVYQSCLSPIDHLQDTDINKYSLQLSLYQHILESENYYPDISDYRRALIHLMPESATPIKLDYYEYEIKEMLKCS